MERVVYKLGDWVEYIRRHYVVERPEPVITHEEGVVTNIFRHKRIKAKNPPRNRGYFFNSE